MNIVNVLLLVVMIVVFIFDSILYNRVREKLKDAETEVILSKVECRRLEGELQTALSRDEAKRSHQCLIRDQKIKEMEEEHAKTIAHYEELLSSKAAEHRILEEMANKIWEQVSGK